MNRPFLVERTFDNDSIFYLRKRVRSETLRSHWHDFYEFEMIVSGHGTTVLNGREYELKSGSCYFLTPGDVHSAIYDEPAEIITIHFFDRFADAEVINRLIENDDNITVVSERNIQRIVSLYELMKSTFDDKDTDIEYASGLFGCIMTLFVSQLDFRYGNIKRPPHIQKAIVYIHSHFIDCPTLGEVADAVFLNKNYFSSLFTECMGMSYKDYLRKVRLECAAGLIRTTLFTVTQIADRSGYTSISNFNRDFKKYFGVSPTQMKKEVN